MSQIEPMSSYFSRQLTVPILRLKWGQRETQSTYKRLKVEPTIRGGRSIGGMDTGKTTAVLALCDWKLQQRAVIDKLRQCPIIRGCDYKESEINKTIVNRIYSKHPEVIKEKIDHKPIQQVIFEDTITGGISGIDHTTSIGKSLRQIITNVRHIMEKAQIEEYGYVVGGMWEHWSLSQEFVGVLKTFRRTDHFLLVKDMPQGKTGLVEILDEFYHSRKAVQTLREITDKIMECKKGAKSLMMVATKGGHIGPVHVDEFLAYGLPPGLEWELLKPEAPSKFRPPNKPEEPEWMPVLRHLEQKFEGVSIDTKILKYYLHIQYPRLSSSEVGRLVTLYQGMLGYKDLLDPETRSSEEIRIYNQQMTAVLKTLAKIPRSTYKDGDTAHTALELLRKLERTVRKKDLWPGDDLKVRSDQFSKFLRTEGIEIFRQTGIYPHKTRANRNGGRERPNLWFLLTEAELRRVETDRLPQKLLTMLDEGPALVPLTEGAIIASHQQ